MNLNRLEVGPLQQRLHLFSTSRQYNNEVKDVHHVGRLARDKSYFYRNTLKRVSPGINPTFASREATATRSISSRW